MEISSIIFIHLKFDSKFPCTNSFDNHALTLGLCTSSSMGEPACGCIFLGGAPFFHRQYSIIIRTNSRKPTEPATTTGINQEG
jgi:hypothetical protein